MQMTDDDVGRCAVTYEQAKRYKKEDERGDEGPSGRTAGSHVLGARNARKAAMRRMDGMRWAGPDWMMTARRGPMTPASQAAD
jgi:hypothetical protein